MESNYMNLAIELSKLGIGYTYPNPLVGAVIVKNNKIIGEGYHKYFGEAHAEINAIKNASENIQGSTMYVTLEPCAHYGKTPPCAEKLVNSGIKKVVIGMKDPNSLVSGKGIDILRKNGIEVVVGVCEKEVKKLNEIFIKYITEKTPFCILKTAMTLDGKIATYVGDSKWISTEKSREYVHSIRHRVSGIMVGVNTIICDNPSLTTRLKDNKGRNATRIIVDSNLRIPLDAKVLNVDKDLRTIIATTKNCNNEKKKYLENIGVEIIETPKKENRVDLKYLMRKLGEKSIDSILLEGGGTLNYSALTENIVDKVISFISPKIIGGEKSKTPVEGVGIRTLSDAILLKDIKVTNFDEDIVVEGYIKKGDN